MKYRVLLIGRNKIIMEDFFQYLTEDFEMQTSSMRHMDIMSHVEYFKPNALIYCMNKEEKERIDTVSSLKAGLARNKVVLVLTGNLEECEAFQRASGEMGDLILKKPITVRSIKDKVVQFLDERKTAEPVDVSVQKTETDALQQAEDLRTSEKLTSQETMSVKKHVLVVDDDPMMLKLIKEQLKDSYTVATAISGAIALKFLENKKTDLIILDYEMPGENGAQVLEKIRNNQATASLPVVFLTGVKDRNKISKLVGLKPQGYLLKPIESEKLIKCIRNIIG